ncbi:glycosyltransferase family A protein [Saccharolobus shibatae]|uniref:Glycosyltransferase 2-like domain-containing protein n=1 Tax=Saccharolobus shibatae TaxID=2286 RepID=A0A8F5C0V1_9CREN|nr:glycosyltransferase family A protein [Saccharolobus shibatae]QXJ34880.1 hypothetical protein J5U22_01427 [Saccharolobus shibatae]
MSKVDLSVILTAYNRKEYIKDAIKSLSAQTLDNSKFEVLYFTNFPDYDNICSNTFKNVKIFHPKNSSWGEWIYLATINADGSVLTFLDDDDMYEKHRLERISNILRKYEESQCIFYINNFIIYKKEISNKNEKDYKVYSINAYNLHEFRKLIRNKIYNNSRIAFSKKLFLDNLNLLRNIHAELFDTLSFSLAYESKCKIIVDEYPLTIIRNTPNSLSKPSMNYLNRSLQITDFILNYIAKSKELRAYLKFGKLYTNYLLHKLHKKECSKLDLNFDDLLYILYIKDIKGLYLLIYNLLFC